MTTIPTSAPASQQAAVDAALLVLKSMGLSLEDLTAAHYRPATQLSAQFGARGCSFQVISKQEGSLRVSLMRARARPLPWPHELPDPGISHQVSSSSSDLGESHRFPGSSLGHVAIFA